MVEKMLTTKLWRVQVLIAGISSALLLVYEALFRTLNPQGLLSSNLVPTVPYLFQVFSSDDLLQTTQIQELSNFGPLGLWYLHIQPPIFDALRYVLVLPEVLMDKQPITSELVDLRLYVLYAIVFGLLNAVLFTWAYRLLASWKWALVITVLWSLYPGNLQMATLLDSTYLSMYFITLCFYFLYMFLRNRTHGYLTAFLAAVLLASYTRTLFQFQFLILMLIALIFFWRMLKGHRRGVLVAVDVVLVLLLFALPLKQYALFGSFSTTTFAGPHRIGMLFYDPPEAEWRAVEYPQRIWDNGRVFRSYPNLEDIVVESYQKERLADQYLKQHPVESVKGLVRSVGVNWNTGMYPTSEYFPNQLAQGVPWRAPMDWLLSGWRYIALVLGAIAVIWWQLGTAGFWRRMRRYGWLVGFYLLQLATLSLANRDDWTEVNRLKIFIEIPAWLAVAYATWLVATRRSRKVPA